MCDEILKLKIKSELLELQMKIKEKIEISENECYLLSKINISKIKVFYIILKLIFYIDYDF